MSYYISVLLVNTCGVLEDSREDEVVNISVSVSL